MTEAERLRRIARAVLSKAEDRALDWNQLGEVKTRFVAKFEGRLIGIQSEDEDDVAPFRLSFYNEEGEEVISIRSIMGAPTDRPDDQELNRNLASIYRAAKDDALKINQYLDDLERDLGI